MSEGLGEEIYDAVIYGATPGGVACAARAAREGLSVLLVSHTPVLGGMLSNGLCIWDTLYEGRRSPIYDEMRQGFFDHYAETYGKDSPEYRSCLPGKSGHTNGRFEPKVARLLFEELVAKESGIEVLRCHGVDTVEREGRRIVSVVFREMEGDGRREARARSFVDASYEGDLMAVAGCAYRVGRESREEFGERYAGVCFDSMEDEPGDERQRRSGELFRSMNLRQFPKFCVVRETEDRGQADRRVQAYNWRVNATDVAANQMPITKPDNYDPEYLRELEPMRLTSMDGMANRKFGVNRPQLVELQHEYPDGDWKKRHEIMDAHWDALQDQLWFTARDPSVPEETRALWRGLGLVKDDFEENGGRPYEIYARETRRLEGRRMLKEQDFMLSEIYQRAPLHADSIAVTEWYIDIHACSKRELPGTQKEGKVNAHSETFPGQVPYACLLPKELDNLLVPVCLSTSHVAWSAVRLEPTWMNIGESAGMALAMAQGEGIDVAEVDVARLQRELVERRVMISFFNDIDLGGGATWNAAVGFLGTKGFFASYDTKAEEPLSEAEAEAWAEGLRGLEGSGGLAGEELAERIWKAGRGDASKAVTLARFVEICGDSLPAGGETAPAESLTRGRAAELLFAAVVGGKAGLGAEA